MTKVVKWLLLAGTVDAGVVAWLGLTRGFHAATFTASASLWASLSLYWTWRYVLRKKRQSIVIALAMLSPVVHVARELKWLPRWPTSLFLMAALTIGIFGVVVVLHHELRRSRPFL